MSQRCLVTKGLGGRRRLVVERSSVTGIGRNTTINHQNRSTASSLTPSLLQEYHRHTCRRQSQSRSQSQQQHQRVLFFSSTTNSDFHPESSESCSSSSSASPPPPLAGNPRTSIDDMWSRTTQRLLDEPVGSLTSNLWGETHAAILYWLGRTDSGNGDGGDSGNDNGNGNDNDNAASLQQSLQLLDRLFQEEQYLQQPIAEVVVTSETVVDGGGGSGSGSATLETSDTSSSISTTKKTNDVVVTAIAIPAFYNTDLLNLVLNHWRQVVSEYTTTVRGMETMSRRSLDPQSIVDQVQRYHHHATATHNFVAATTSFRSLRPNTQTFAMIIDGAASFVSSSKSSEPPRHRRIIREKNNSVDNRKGNGGGGNGGGGGGGEDGVLVADRLLPWIIQESSKHAHLRPNVVTFSSLMNAWVKSRRPEAAERVEALLDEMQGLTVAHPDWNVAPNQVTYATAIDAWAKAGRVDRAEGLLQDMHAEYKLGATELKPNVLAMNGYLVALARAGEMDRAEDFLDQMEDLYASGELEEAPNVISYSTVLDAFSKSRQEGAAERAEAILRQMKDRGVVANSISWNTVIHAYVQHRNIDRAEALLREMNDEYLQQGNQDVKPTMRTYSVVLSGWSKTRSPKAGERAEQLLGLMKTLAESGELEPLDIVAYNSVLDCWAKSSSKQAGVKAKAFLETMIQDGVEPDAYSYNTVTSALVREGRLEEAESMLDFLASHGAMPDITAYNTLLNAWIKSRSKDSATRVKKLYSRMKEDSNVEADLITMNTLINFYSRTGNAEIAESLLEEMCSPDSQVLPDSISFNTVVAAWTRSQNPKAPERAEAILNKMLEYGGDVEPNVITFNSLLNAWVKTNPENALESCQRIVGIMREMVDNGNDSVKPDAITYNTLIHAHVRSNDDQAREDAYQIFKEMRRRYQSGETRLKPSVHTYGSLINGWSKSSGNPESGGKAVEILRLWLERADCGEVDGRPRVFEFTAAMRALSNCGDPKAIFKVDELLYLLLQDYERGNESAAPDSRMFTVVLRALALSHVTDKAKYADKILGLMKAYKIRPDRFKIEQLKICYATGTQREDNT